MTTKFHRDSVYSEATSIRFLLESASESDDPLGTHSLKQRLVALEEEIKQIDESEVKTANVALIFGGNPVKKTHGIKANFATQAVKKYQELIEKHIAMTTSATAEGKRASTKKHPQSQVNITGIVHGSFGFVLEEDDTEQINAFDSPAKIAVESISELLNDVTAEEEQVFDSKLGELDTKTFDTLKQFIKTLHDADATLKISEKDQEVKLTAKDIDRAHKRISITKVDENDEEVEGMLLGLVPLQRRFDFRCANDDELIQGQVDNSLSEDYLNKIERDRKVPPADGWRATIRTKTISHPSGRKSVQRILIELNQIES